MSTYTFKFNNKPTQANFNAIAGEVLWDAVPAGCVYTCTNTADSITLVMEKGQLTAQDQATIQQLLQDLAVEFA